MDDLFSGMDLSDFDFSFELPSISSPVQTGAVKKQVGFVPHDFKDDNQFLQNQLEEISLGNGKYDISKLVSKEEIVPVPHKIAHHIEKYAEYCQNEWVRGVLNLWSYDDSMMVVVLTGDAGSGKTTTIKKLTQVLDSLGAGSALRLSAPTHKAASVLSENARTTASLMGWNFEMCQMSFEKFKEEYTFKNSNIINAWNILKKESALIAQKNKTDTHKCDRLSIRCKACMKSIVQFMLRLCNGFIPPFLGSSIILIDEYGILSESMFMKIIFVLQHFVFDDQGYLIICSGSISQLPSPERPRIWESTLFKNMIVNTTPLLINFRQASDTPFSNALRLMQYNLISNDAVEILNERVIGEKLANSPLFKPQLTRIFNANSLRDEYNMAYSKLTQKEVILKAKINSIKDTSRGKCTMADALKAIRQKYPKIFTRNNSTQYLYIGGVVGQLQKCSERLTLLSHNKKKEEIVLSDIISKQTVIIKMKLEKFKNWAIEFFPVYAIQGINTYSCQGDTLENGVVYCPPKKNYFRSEIKPSAYVAMSRVTTRDRLFLSYNPFTTPGTNSFFTTEELLYKKCYEQAYQ